MTSNVGTKIIKDFGPGIGFNTKSKGLNSGDLEKSILEKELKKKFSPEFINRLDEIIVFNSLKEEDIHKIIYNELAKLRDRIKEMGYDIKIQKSAVEFVAKNGYDAAYGARPLNRAIQRYIEDASADEILNGNFKEGETINITLDKDKSEIVLKSIKPKQ
jgi:ATP-dependent Clp protease ATP-binding subunit ClpC